MQIKVKRSLAGVAGVVALATLASKGMGFFRQLLIAATFGSGPEYSAFAVAYVLPGFLLILLGGINGPFHSAIISILRKRPDQDHSHWLESITTLVSLILLGIMGLLIGFADPLVVLIAPGASPEVHQLAAQQLQIMSPLAVLAGLIGIGFGSLNGADQYLLPALSPLLSSSMVIGAVVIFGHTGDPVILAWGTLLGALAQWLIQVPVQAQAGLGRPRLRFEWRSPEVKAVGLLMLPAVISAGMVHINVYVDMFFASFVPGDRTIGNLGYAQLLVQTPLGILSNMVLVPLMPLFSSLAVPGRREELRARIQQGLGVTALTILPMSMLLSVLAQPIVQIAYERGRWTPEITAEVAALLSAYGIGMVFYLLRDVVVRIFYALEQGQIPLQVSLFAIFLNAGLDAVGLHLFGAPGLALATAGVNLIALILLGVMLHRQVEQLPWIEIFKTLGWMLMATGLSAGSTWGIWRWTQDLAPDPGLIGVMVQAGLAAGVGLGVFGLGVWILPISESRLVVDRLLRLLRIRRQEDGTFES